MSTIIMEAIKLSNSENILDLLENASSDIVMNKCEVLSNVGTNLLFIRNNLSECIDMFGSKVTSELIEELQFEYNNIVNEGKGLSDDLPEIKPFIDVQAIWKTIETHGNEIAAAALIALVIAGAYKAYKNYFSKAAKACKDKKGDEKIACMTNYEARALSIQKKILNRSLDSASKSSEPKKFIDKIQNEVNKIKKKIQNIK